MLDKLIRSTGIILITIGATSLHSQIRIEDALRTEYLSQQKTVTDSTKKEALEFARERGGPDTYDCLLNLGCIYAGAFLAIPKRKKRD